MAKSEAEAIGIEGIARAAEAGRLAAVEQAQLAAQVAAFEKQMAAIQPELINTLKQLGNTQLVGELSKNLSPLAILGGDSVADVAGRLLESLPLGMGPTPASHGTVASILGPQPFPPPTTGGKKSSRKSAS